MKKYHIKCISEESNTSAGIDFSCGYETTISCDDCKYGGYTNQPDGRRGKDPEAICNQPKDVLI